MKQHNLLNGIRSALAAFALIWALPSQATDVNVFSCWLGEVNYTWQGAAEKASVANFMKDNSADFGYFCGPKNVSYFPFTVDGQYSVTNLMVVMAYGGIHVFAWKTDKFDLVKRYAPVQIGSNGKADACVFSAKSNGDLFAMIAPTEDNFNRHQAFTDYIATITNEYPGVMVFVGTTERYAKPHPDTETFLNDTLGYIGSKQSDSCGGIYTPAKTGVSIVSQDAITIGTIAKEPAVLACVRYPSVFRVKFQDWDGTELQNTLVAENGSVTPPEDPERAGYEFIGWDHEDSEFECVTNNITATAQYKPLDTNYNVTFNDWDDSLINQVSIPKNTPVGRPADPTRQYYTFRAWKNGDVDWNFADPVASNMTLKADYALNAVNDIGDAASLAAIFAAGLPDSVIIRLTNDISFASVAYTPADFSGILDGNGHYITGLPNNGKLFAVLSGTVHDLTLKDIGTGATIDSSGGILADSAQGATVYNCVIENANRSYSSANIKCGGYFVSSTKDANDRITVISNCIVRNSRFLISADRDSQYVGGFVASASNTEFVDCRFESTNVTATIVGGMATYASGIVASGGTGLSFRRCSAQGLITAGKYLGYEFGGASGIVGYIGENVTLVDCTNEARCVTASGNGAGGIIGHIYGNNKRFEVVGAVNRGAIVVEPGSNTGRGGGAGGIVGGSYGGTTISVFNSANYGEVVSSDFAGGIMGQSYGATTSCSLLASNVFNYASITADGASGGIAGNFYGSYGSRMLNVGNAGAIASLAGAAGGLLGKLTTYGNTDRMILDGIMQNGQVTTASGCASLGIGTLDSMTWVNNVIEFRSAVMAGSAAATDGGQVGSLCGGFIVVSTSKAVTFSADANCRLLGTYSTTYYDYQGQPQTLDITAMTAADLKSKSGSVKLLNDNATAKGYVAWVQGENYPELSLFAQEVVKSTGLAIFFR